MEFRQVKKRGQRRKNRRTWLSDDHYRIVWRREICGVRVPAHFQATVRTIIPNYGGVSGESFLMWDFTDAAHRLFKVRGKAEESCERHRRLWSKACEATGARQLTEIFGKLPNGFPAWVRKRLNRKVYEVLIRPRIAKHQEDDEPCSSPPDQPEACDIMPRCSAGPPSANDPASPATGEAGTTPRPIPRARSKVTSTSDNSDAPPAAARAKERKQRSSKRTAKRSKAIAQRKPSTTSSPKSGGKRSANSRRKKRAPCGS
jgi:hypothetical protein